MVEFDVTVGLILAKMVLQIIATTALSFGTTHKDVLRPTQILQ